METHPASEVRIAQIKAQHGVKSSRSGLFGDEVIYNDGTRTEGGVFGCSYYFSDGTRVEAGVFGYETDNEPVKESGRNINTQGSTVISSGRGNRISINGAAENIQIGNGNVMVNGRNYTGKIPPGASIDVIGGKVYANGKLVE